MYINIRGVRCTTLLYHITNLFNTLQKIHSIVSYNIISSNTIQRKTKMGEPYFDIVLIIAMCNFKHSIDLHCNSNMNIFFFYSESNLIKFSSDLWRRFPRWLFHMTKHHSSQRQFQFCSSIQGPSILRGFFPVKYNFQIIYVFMKQSMLTSITLYFKYKII